MVENTKCECGHQNPVETILCEACGKPLQEDYGTEPLEMRYDGVARRSQKTNRTWIDRIWSFFSSVKIAIYLIIITLLLAMLGTIFPQENTFIDATPQQIADYYSTEHGVVGQVYHFIGLSRTYETWWFLTLLFMIGTSLVVCSLDRVLPLYRALHKQKVRKHRQFLSRQRIVFEYTLENEEKQVWLEEFTAKLKRKRYKVRREEDAIMAEKNRFSRWGPYINHIGLIIFLLAALLRSLIPGWYMDEYISLQEGEIKKLPGTPYYIENEQFTVEFYRDEEMNERFREEGRIVPKLFETKAVLYRCIEQCDDPSQRVLEEVHRHDIQVNRPLNYDHVMAYQFDYDFSPEIRSLDVQLADKQTGEIFGEFHLNTSNPEENYKVGAYNIELRHYYPDFVYEDGSPATQSPLPKAPAFVFVINGPGLEKEQVHMYFPRPDDKIKFQQDAINNATGSPFEIKVESMERVEISLYTSFLNIRKDRIIPFIFVGAGISMLGLIMGFYWQHRRIWLRLDGNRLLLGAHTNKNWFGLRKDVADALLKTGIKADPKSLDNGVKRV